MHVGSVEVCHHFLSLCYRVHLCILEAIVSPLPHDMYGSQYIYLQDCICNLLDLNSSLSICDSVGGILLALHRTSHALGRCLIRADYHQ